MEHKVIIDKTYMVSAITETTVTDVASGWSKTIPAHTQDWVYAISDKIEISGECVIRPFVQASR